MCGNDEFEDFLFSGFVGKITITVWILLAILLPYISLILGARAEIEKINKEYPGAYEAAQELLYEIKEDK